MDVRADKEHLRAELKARRTALTPRELQVAGDAAARLITQLPEWKQDKTVREPKPTAPVAALADAGLILVPGLGFDGTGRRLGFGGGFYDRLLAKPPRQTFLLGHAHSFQLETRLPDEPHDIKVKAVATPQGVIRCRVR
jgi:5-formyltetrahydrofolate cyclo-ligase